MIKNFTSVGKEKSIVKRLMSSKKL